MISDRKNAGISNFKNKHKNCPGIPKRRSESPSPEAIGVNNLSVAAVEAPAGDNYVGGDDCDFDAGNHDNDDTSNVEWILNTEPVFPRFQNNPPTTIESLFSQNSVLRVEYSEWCSVHCIAFAQANQDQVYVREFHSQY